MGVSQRVADGSGNILDHDLGGRAEVSRRQIKGAIPSDPVALDFDVFILQQAPQRHVWRPDITSYIMPELVWTQLMST